MGQRLTAGKHLNKRVIKRREMEREIAQLKKKLTFEEKQQVIDFMKELLTQGGRN